MKITNNIRTYIALLAGIALLASCSDDVTAPTYSVGEADNAIVLRAGISEGSTGVATRAGAEDHHSAPGHKTFTANTKLTLRVDGTWKGKADGTAPHGTIAGTLVSQKATATIGDAFKGDAENDTENTHNKVTFTPTEQLYWDDYGTADPANMNPVDGNGRAKGLTIYGVAIDGKTDAAPTVSSWTALEWNVGSVSDGAINQTGGWATLDLLTSNNVQLEDNDKPYSTDGTYKFDERNDGKLLEFTHAMTKITVNLTAGEGFPGYETAPANAQFQAAPTVTLLGFNYTGTVNVEDKTSTPTDATTTDISMRLAEGGASNHTAQYDALVFPGNQFTATIADDAPKYTPTSATDILELNADGNIYRVTAAQLVKAMNAAGATGAVDGTIQQGKNYVLNITVNKTKIVVTATIKDWEDVNTEEVAPKINVTATYGYTVGQAGSTAFTGNYDLFRSTVKATGYDEDNVADGIQYAARFTSPNWNKSIYWPDHQTHYFFRGVYPQVGTAASGTTLPNEAVTTVNSNDVVAVANAAYTAASYPSDLAIAFPRGTTEGSYDETCKVHTTPTTEGICATEGIINMNFEYAMSKVEVRLKSSAEDDGHIAMTKDNIKVDIIGGYNKARIKLSDGLHDAYTDADKGTYALSNLSTPETGFLVTTRDAIVPQEIGNDVIFRITVTTDDNHTPGDTSDDKNDVYECKVKLIKETSTDTPVTEWVHGKHYIYVLDINKTAINVTATLKDWVEVTAEDNVWF